MTILATDKRSESPHAICPKRMSRDREIRERSAEIKKGGAPKYHQKNAQQNKLFARERLERLLDRGSLVEDALLANAGDRELPADGVITGVGTVAGRTVAVMAN